MNDENGMAIFIYNIFSYIFLKKFIQLVSRLSVYMWADVACTFKLKYLCMTGLKFFFKTLITTSATCFSFFGRTQNGVYINTLSFYEKLKIKYEVDLA